MNLLDTRNKVLGQRRAALFAEKIMYMIELALDSLDESRPFVEFRECSGDSVVLVRVSLREWEEAVENADESGSGHPTINPSSR